MDEVDITLSILAEASVVGTVFVETETLVSVVDETEVRAEIIIV